MYTLNCRGKIISLETPVVMGIINATTDSFYKGDLAGGRQGMLELAEKMIREGAGIIDIGGQSTRPGSEAIPAKAEIASVIPVIQLIREHNENVVISIDTYYSDVARRAIEAGADMVNDISGGELDPAMLETVAAMRTPYICMHMKGTPATMQTMANYADITSELLDYFAGKIFRCKQAGITDVIIDPGFGFAKTIEHNLKLLNELTAFKMLDKPILAGLSRKGTVYRTLGITAGEALNGTTVLNTIALLNGANLLRVHDVKEAMEAVKLTQAYKNASS